MLTLPAKFAEENSKADKTPALLVQLVDQEISNEQTSQADWAANSLNSQVEWTSSPGDVKLATVTPPIEGQSAYTEGKSVWCYYCWQSFKQNTGAAKSLTKVRITYTYNDTINPTVRCEIWNAAKTTMLGYQDATVPYTGPYGGSKAWLDFNFGTPVTVQDDTTYWIKVYFLSGGGSAHVYWWFTNNTGAYTKGQFDAESNAGSGCGDQPFTNGGDAAFEVHFTGNYYQPSGYIRTQTMDLGETPVGDGEWILEDMQPAGTSLAYQAWASDTGAFGGEETNLGTIQDGQAITVLKRYYRVRADFTATNRSYTPTLQRIKANFFIYRAYADNPVLGYEAALKSVSSLTTTIDTFNASTISQITLKFAFVQSLSNWLATKYPKNKVVKIKAGFIASGFAEADYIDYFWGQVDDWSIDRDDTVSIVVKDYKKEWAVKVPSKWQSVSDDVTWTNQHPIDVMLDLLQNRINVRDSKIDLASFNTVKTALSGWKVTRTITGNPEEADKLLEELRRLCSCFFVPQANGAIKIKRWDPNEAAAESLADGNTRNLTWEANAGALINEYYHYYAWDGAGDNASDFGSLSFNQDSTSKANWDETKAKEMKDKWTKATESAQVTDLAGKIMARYANPPAIINAEMDRRFIALEVGDMVTVTTKRAPSSDMSGITNEKYQIINRNLDFKSDWIKLKLLKAA